MGRLSTRWQSEAAMAERGERLFWVATAGVAAVVLLGGVAVTRAPGPAGATPRGRAAPPKLEKRPAGPSRFSPWARLRRAQIFAQVQGDEAFKRLAEPDPGDWLFHFREHGQTLEEYAARVVNRKTAERRQLHLQPFSDLASHQRGLLEPMRAHTAVFFDTETLALAPRSPDPRWLEGKRGQYDADRIVASLARRVPASSLGLFGLMGSDLHGLGLNFVFGEALLDRRAGIYSVHRFGREPRSLLRRALKLASHEIGHLFGLHHCIFYECVMNGTNSLVETDRRPLHLCPVCLAKLKWNLRFDPVKRYRALGAFYQQHGLREEASFALARAAELAR
jgi:archaemetzincin